ncbi:outer membrane lipoprotein-sorting protein [Nitrogeniibacter mangrovi]|uniref:Outer membrane lipoprotein-sorting protein n=1 Tax=Nitrogeniibacter mangrovi TaxID=2016596 RepID=A0A6C1B8H8_9RHOO|nr:outer membrane lipoprotein-sorting protein [Nitrogeniibacter mangrovi]QID18554.1 outer membrane lipoprotein-sorting protein [Nitrogeniibacter mangrovi]
MTQPFRIGKRLFTASILAFAVSAAFAADTGPAPDPQALVAAADAVRFPRDSFQVDIDILSRSADDPEGESRRYRVLSKGNDDTVILTMEPASERGQILLMSGRNLWVFMPSVSQPVRLSLAQRLTGQVANGDLARANFAGDYTPTYVGEDTIDGEPAHVLELTAVDGSVTYAKVKYWIGRDDNHPLKAEFYAVSGRLLKTCRYEDFKKMAGTLRPTRLVMTDALKSGDVSTLTYRAMTPRPLPNKLFTKDYLKKLN